MKIDAQLRAARTQDMAGCAAIFNDWVDETAWMPRVHSREDVAGYYRTVVATQRKTSVVIAGREIVGLMTVDADDLVTALYVSRLYRGQGIGRLLLDRAKRDAAEAVTLWTFQKNVGALAFYAREGFVEINRTDGDNEEELPDILMEWRA